MKITNIEIKYTLEDETEIQATVGGEGGWKQWGASPSKLAETFALTDAINNMLYEMDDNHDIQLDIKKDKDKVGIVEPIITNKYSKTKKGKEYKMTVSVKH